MASKCFTTEHCAKAYIKEISQQNLFCMNIKKQKMLVRRRGTSDIQAWRQWSFNHQKTHATQVTLYGQNYMICWMTPICVR